MKVIKSSLMLILYLLSNILYSQNSQIKPLAIGDVMPEFTFRNVWNYKTKTAKLSDFNGKLIILDFWSTGCTACIEAFPKMSSLQKQFESKIQILLVNSHFSKWETADKLKRVISQYKIRTGDALDLPMPIFDTLLNYYFPHQSVPHEVWIDGHGKVLAITTGQYVNEENIQDFVDNKTINLPVKNDFLDFDPDIPLLINGNGGDQMNFIYRSLLAKYNSAVKTMIGERRNVTGETIRYFIYNYPLKSLIDIAYSEIISGMSAKRIIFEVDVKYFDKKKDTLGLYCYDLSFGSGRMNFDPKPFLKNDLNSVFNITGSKKLKKINVYVVRKIPEPGVIKTKYYDDDHDLRENSIKKYFHHFSLSEVFKILEAYTDKPLIDETGISNQKIDIDFPNNFDLSNQRSVIKFLKNIGFEIKEEERELEVVVITDK